MQGFIAFSLVVFAFCIVMTVYRLHQKIRQRREQIAKKLEAASRQRVDAAAGVNGTPFADIGLGKPPEVHDLLSQLDMEQQALKKAKFDKIIEAEARHKEKLTAEAQKQAMNEVLRESRINIYQKLNEKQKEPPAAEKKKAFAKTAQNKNEREREQEEQRRQEQQKNEEKESVKQENENQRREQEQEKNERQREQEHQKEIDKIQELRGVKEAESAERQPSSGAEPANSRADSGAQNSGGYAGGMSGGHSGGR